jgi:1-deoxy-D-xylulose-5-phosphate reductoisomerase
VVTLESFISPIVPLGSGRLSSSLLQPDEDGRIQRVAVFGSTGSVGVQALDVLRRMPDRFVVTALVAHQAAAELAEQARTFRPRLIGIDAPAVGLDVLIDSGAEVMTSAEAMMEVATDPDIDIVVIASSGHSAIEPTLAALRAGKIVALANKEAIVCAGPLLVAAVREGAGQVRPVDSEHSAIWQSLGHSDGRDIRRLILTASGGPFRRMPLNEMRTVTAAQALAHPTWKMGGKITIDSATLMNKGLELIEARWLFGVEPEQLDVLVHPESIIHSLVEYDDASQIAQLSLPDMRLPIQFALTWPEHAPSPCRSLSLADVGQLTFEQPDLDRFPALGLAREVMRQGDTFPTVLSAVDEVAVHAFLEGRLPFMGITDAVASVVDRHQPGGELSVEAIDAADAWARREARQWIGARS